MKLQIKHLVDSFKAKPRKSKYIMLLGVIIWILISSLCYFSMYSYKNWYTDRLIEKQIENFRVHPFQGYEAIKQFNKSLLERIEALEPFDRYNAFKKIDNKQLQPIVTTEPIPKDVVFISLYEVSGTKETFRNIYTKAVGPYRFPLENEADWNKISSKKNSTYFFWISPNKKLFFINKNLITLTDKSDAESKEIPLGMFHMAFIGYKAPSFFILDAAFFVFIFCLLLCFLLTSLHIDKFKKNLNQSYFSVKQKISASKINIRTRFNDGIRLKSIQHVEEKTISGEDRINPANQVPRELLKRGEIINGRYEVVNIFVGGVCVVYEVDDMWLSERVALKTLLPDYFDNKDIRSRLVNEVKVSRSFKHENIIQVYDLGKMCTEHFGRMVDIYYFTMEYINGQTLKEWLRDEKQKKTYMRVLNVIRKVCSGLEYIHNKGSFHRDIKPENIMLDENDNVTIVDFGLAKLLDNVGDITRIGGAGTPKYMPPEQDKGKGDYRVDIYALGAISYLMLSGKLPEEPGRSRASSNNQRLSGKVDDVLNKAMAYYPSDRYQDITIFIKELEDSLSESTIEMTDLVHIGNSEELEKDDPTADADEGYN